MYMCYNILGTVPKLYFFKFDSFWLALISFFFVFSGIYLFIKGGFVLVCYWIVVQLIDWLIKCNDMTWIYQVWLSQNKAYNIIPPTMYMHMCLCVQLTEHITFSTLLTSRMQAPDEQRSSNLPKIKKVKLWIRTEKTAGLFQTSCCCRAKLKLITFTRSSGMIFETRAKAV